MNAHSLTLLSIRPASATRTLERLRGQAALARALLDELDRAVPHGSNEVISAQLVEELARLGCQLIDAASALSSHLDNGRSTTVRE